MWLLITAIVQGMLSSCPNGLLEGVALRKYFRLKISAVRCLSSLACRYIKNNRREDGKKVKSRRKLSLSNTHKELQKNANSRKNLNFKMEDVFVVKSRGIGFGGRLKSFSVMRKNWQFRD